MFTVGAWPCCSLKNDTADTSRTRYAHVMAGLEACHAAVEQKS